MNEGWNEFVERHENEATVVQTRMRKGKKLSLHTRVFTNKEVEIYGPRTHVNFARTTEGIFDSQKARHDLFGRRKCGTTQFGDHVEKRGLVLIFDCFSFVNVRQADHVESGFEHASYGQQETTGTVAEV